MLNLGNGIDSLTIFKRQTADYLRQLRASGSPVILTVNGKPEVVVQAGHGNRDLLDDPTPTT